MDQQKTKANDANKQLATVSQLEVANPGVEVMLTAYPRRIKIYQSDKQDKFFIDKENLRRTMYGDLFVLDEDGTTTTKSLTNEIRATLLKASMGFYVIEEDTNKIVGSGKGLITKNIRQGWLDAHPGYTYQNVVRIIMTDMEPEEAIETMQMGSNPFLELVLKGASFSAWFSVGAKRSTAIKNSGLYDGVKNINNLIAPTVQLVITTVKQTNNNGIEYYIPNIDVDVNPPDVANKYLPLFTFWIQRSLFGNFDRDVKVEETSTLDVDAVAKELGEANVIDTTAIESKKVNDVEDDLPF